MCANELYRGAGKLYTFEVSEGGVGAEAEVRCVGSEKLQAFTGVVDVEDTTAGQDRMIAGFRVRYVLASRMCWRSQW